MEQQRQTLERQAQANKVACTDTGCSQWEDCWLLRIDTACEATECQVHFPTLQNPDFLSRNPDFLLKNVEFMIKHSANRRSSVIPAGSVPPQRQARYWQRIGTDTTTLTSSLYENHEFCIQNEELCIKITQKRGIMCQK